MLASIVKKYFIVRIINQKIINPDIRRRVFFTDFWTTRLWMLIAHPIYNPMYIMLRTIPFKTYWKLIFPKIRHSSAMRTMHIKIMIFLFAFFCNIFCITAKVLHIHFHDSSKSQARVLNSEEETLKTPLLPLDSRKSILYPNGQN